MLAPVAAVPPTPAGSLSRATGPAVRVVLWGGRWQPVAHASVRHPIRQAHCHPVVAIPMLACVVAGMAPLAPEAAAQTRSAPAAPAVAGTISGTLRAVAATSASNAWAVGSTGSPVTPKTLIMHWIGKTWKRQPTPSLAAKDIGALSGVAAVSASDAWAVGTVSAGTGSEPPILRWNGTSWKRVPSPGLSAIM